MANLILTTDCQRKCSYCFAQEDKNKKMVFEWENFIKATDLIATGPKIVNLLGGEPTLHKDFVKMLEYLIIKDFRIQVFTNGLVSNRVINNLTKLLNSTTLRKDQLYFAINFNEVKYRSNNETETQIKFVKNFNKIVYPSFTIQDVNTDLLFLNNIVNEYSTDKTIRLGLAMPIVGGHNKYLPIEAYKNTAANIIELADNSPGTNIIFDCGFPLCMFTIEEISRLSRNKENQFSFLCGQPLDIYPDLTVTNCYPLSKMFKIKISEFKNIFELYKFYEEGFMTPYGIYKEKCQECAFFRKVCFGGCKSFYCYDKNKDYLKIKGGDNTIITT